MRQLTRDLLRRMILEAAADAASEPGTEGRQEPSGMSADSLDDQIDSLLMKYETDSIVPPDDIEEELIDESHTLRRVYVRLFEQEEEEGGEEEAEEVGSEEDVVVGSEDIEVEEEGDERQPNINVDLFAGHVNRLIMNFGSLLDPLTVILNRSQNYLRSKYDKVVVDEFIEIMAQQYGMELNPIDDTQPPPAAAGAGSSPGGV